MRRTIIGLDLEKEHSQISYYSERTGEPESVSIAENQDKYLIPTPDGFYKKMPGISESCDGDVRSVYDGNNAGNTPAMDLPYSQRSRKTGNSRRKSFSAKLSGEFFLLCTESEKRTVVSRICFIRI